MSLAHPEIDERRAELKRRARQDEGRAMLRHLAGLGVFETKYDRMDVERLTRAAALTDQDLTKLKALAWKYRRHLPREVAPRLPPHDPVVKAMEAADG